MEIVQDAAEFLIKTLPPNDAFLVPPPAPSKMSVKEIKEAIREYGLTRGAAGLTEKHELVELLEQYYRDNGATV